jgi:hypothetical protein
MMAEPTLQAAVAVPENRYLLVVETSAATANRVDGICEAVQGALVSGMKGQLHSGDTLGLWTFNQDLSTGKFPLQTWTPEADQTVRAAVLKHLRQQRCAKRPLLDPVMVALKQVILDSDFLTVVLITSGQAPIRGTPFDQKINEIFNDWGQKQQDARMPMLTVLRAKKGRITDYRISAAPFPIEMPPLPAELDPRALAQKATPVPKPQAPPVMGQPLIVSGKKPAPILPLVTPQLPTPDSGKVVTEAAMEPPRITNLVVSSSEPVLNPVTTNATVLVHPPSPKPAATTNTVREWVQEKPATTNATAASTAPAAPPPKPPPIASAPPVAEAVRNPAPTPVPLAAQIQTPDAGTAAAPPPVPTIASRSLAPVSSAPLKVTSVQSFIWLCGGLLLVALSATVWVALRSSKRSHHHTSLITESMGSEGP